MAKYVLEGLMFNRGKLLVKYQSVDNNVLQGETLLFAGTLSDHNKIGKIFELEEQPTGRYSVPKQPCGVYTDNIQIEMFKLNSQSEIDKYKLCNLQIKIEDGLIDKLKLVKSKYKTMSYHERQSFIEAIRNFLEN